ncbi:MAG: class I SAM-dependent methyltransferase [Thermoleophilia bacterium]
MLWLDPMPLPGEMGKAYRNYYTHQDPLRASNRVRRLSLAVRAGYWARKYGYNGSNMTAGKRTMGMLSYLHPGWRARLDFLIFYLPSALTGTLLEVGCGSGEKLAILQDLGWQVEGVDFDPGAVENAKKKGLKVHLGTLEKQQFPEGHFDVVVMSHLIEHVHDPRFLLDECRRIIRPGGRLVVITPNAESLWSGFFKESCLSVDPPRHMRVFTLPSIKTMVINAGFHVRNISTTVRGADGLFSASRSIQRTGRSTIELPVNFRQRMEGKSRQIFQAALLKIRPEIGEDIVVVAETSDCESTF